jgi:hypothetical protein
MKVTTSDKVFIGMGLLLALASAAVFGTMVWRHIGFPSGEVPTVELAAAGYEAKAPEAPAVRTETWAAPVAQSRGRDWIYDTFTPPEIFYNARSKQFTVRPPSSLVEEVVQEDFGIELVAVQPEPFRLQLIGYVGAGGSWKGTFLNGVTGEVFLAGAGRRVTGLGVTIKSLDVNLQPVRGGEGGMVTQQRVATAVVTDEKTGRDVVLTHRERHFTGMIFAFVAAPGDSASREVRTGDIFKLGEATYKIESVQMSPPSIEITKEAPSQALPDRRSLTPREAELPETPERPGAT